MGVPVVALYGSLNAIFNVILAVRVSGARRRGKKSIGTDGNEVVLLANRVHGNNAEYVPLAIVMLLVVELAGGSSNVLHAMGGALLLARFAHAFGLPRPAPNPYRVMGMVGTWLVILGASGYAIYLR